MNTRYDLAYVRANPEEFDRRLGLRGLKPLSAEILGRDQQRREFLHKSETLRSEAKSLQKLIGQLKRNGEDADAETLIRQATSLNEFSDKNAGYAAEADDGLQEILAGIPNLAADDVPLGLDETFNVEIHAWGGTNRYANVGEHDAAKFNYGFDVASKISGSRFSMLIGPIARLHRALGQFMLDQQIARGFEEVIPPLLVRPDTMFGTGQLPKFKDDLFRTPEEDGNQFYLIPTAEVALTNIVREQILPQGNNLLLRFVALTQCFRAEAGAAGRDTRGLIRQHQFEKVELVSITTPEQSAEEHEFMTRSAELILEALELPYRRVLLCAGDMGFSAQKTFDLEVWMPGANRYREISSVSNCGDFQARRMNARLKRPNGNEFVHTLNGSGLAVGRTLAALVENNWIDEQTIAIPKALRPYLGGLEVWKSGF